MRLLPTTTTALLLMAAASAQNALSTNWTANAFLNSHDGAVYFDLTAGKAIEIYELDVNLFSPLGTKGEIEVWIRPDQFLGHTEANIDWMHAASGTVFAAGLQQPTRCVLDRPVALPVGSYGVALRHRDVKPAYVQSVVWQTFGTSDLRLTGGASALMHLGSSIFAPRIFSGTLRYRDTTAPHAVARAERFGERCQQGARSFYELFPAGTFDLDHQRLQLLPNAVGGYDVVRGPTPNITLPQNATNLGLTPGSAAFVQLTAPLQHPAGTTSRVLVFADGRVVLKNAGLLALPPVPDPAELFRGGAALLVANWCALAPHGARNVYTATTPTGATRIIYWDVPAANVSAPGRTFEIVVHPDNRLEIAWNLGGSPAGNGDCLVGYGVGDGGRDPGPFDLTSAATFVTRTDHPGLGQQPIGRPVVGERVRVDLTDVRHDTIASALVFGWHSAAHATELSAVGAPGCYQHVAGTGMTQLGLGTASSALLAIPPAPTLLGVAFTTQAVSWSPAVNALGLVASNGVRWTIGDV